ncbi:MAG: RpiB/LacA/LacB family sugar-phosphate isomerase [Armatimonadetes bacterium]|nr:RpiB/LacA/LacB family sugar-phosphate isomerase [Armatimonadota bacterium]
MRIAVGADNFGAELKDAVKAHLTAAGHDVQDLGGEAPYYATAAEAARRIGHGQAERAILCCGTGMGMAIIANKFPGVYAAVCENAEAAEKSRSINNSNVLTLGGFLTTPEAAREIVHRWMSTEFTAGWNPEIKAWLENSMKDIALLEERQFGAGLQAKK